MKVSSNYGKPAHLFSNKEHPVYLPNNYRTLQSICLVNAEPHGQNAW